MYVIRARSESIFMDIPFTNLRAQFLSIEQEVTAAVTAAMRRCDYVLGEDVAAFEEEFGKFVGTKYALGVASGVEALRLALVALDIGAGAEVIVPANTFIATVLAVEASGAHPVVVDCTPDTYGLSPELVERAVTGRTRAIIPVHLMGQACDMDQILRIAETHGLRVIEDAAQAHGATWQGRTCGSIGDIGCFSFYPSKNLGACGDGGMVTTNSDQVARLVRQFRHYGQSAEYEHVVPGWNSRLDTIQAAVLRVKLRHLPEWNAARGRCAELYFQFLDEVPEIALPVTAAANTHVYHRFVIQTERRDGLRAHLAAAGVETGVHYPSPVHMQKALKHLGHSRGSFPVAEALSGRMLSLPIYPELGIREVISICTAIREYFGHPWDAHSDHPAESPQPI